MPVLYADFTLFYEIKFMLKLWFLWELYALFYENVPKNVGKTEKVKLQLNDNTSMHSSNLKNQDKQVNII